MSAATGYFVPGSSWLHDRNPLTKLIGLFAVLVSAFVLPPIVLPFLIALLVVAAWSAGVLWALAGAMRIPAVLLLSIVLVNAFVFPGATDRLFGIGPIGVTREGLAFGLISAGRVLVAFLASVLFLITTLADDLLEALVARGASHRIAFVVLSAMQLVPRLQGRASAILDAQQARGLDISGSLRRRLGAVVPLVGPILLGSLIDVRERTFALEARGFGAGTSRSAYRIVPDPAADRVLRPLLLLTIVAVIAVGVFGVGR